MKRYLLAASATMLAILVPLKLAAGSQSLQLIKDPYCDCCQQHALYLQQQGFSVEIVTTENLPAIKSEHGVPEALAGCHTILAQGYVIEGHVPAGAIKKLLREQPAIKGISLPGMPLGSPGMDGEKTAPLEVVVIEEGMPKLYYSE